MKPRTAGEYSRRYAERGNRMTRLPRSARRGQHHADVRRFLNAVRGYGNDSAEGLSANHAARTVNIDSLWYARFPWIATWVPAKPGDTPGEMVPHATQD